MNVDLAAAGTTSKERYNMSVTAEAVKHEQLEHLHSWLREWLTTYRSASADLPRLSYKPKLK